MNIGSLGSLGLPSPKPLEPRASTPDPFMPQAKAHPSGGLRPTEIGTVRGGISGQHTRLTGVQHLSPSEAPVTARPTGTLAPVARQEGELPTLTLTKPRPRWLPPNEPLTRIATGQIVPAAWIHTEWRRLHPDLEPTYKKGLEIEDNHLLKEPLILEEKYDFSERQLRHRVRPGDRDPTVIQREFCEWTEDKGTMRERDWLDGKTIHNMVERLKARNKSAQKSTHM